MRSITETTIRAFATTSAAAQEIAEKVYPDLFVPPLKIGDIVRSPYGTLGIVAGGTVGGLVSQRFGLGSFTVVGGQGSWSYRDARSATGDGWRKVEVGP